MISYLSGVLSTVSETQLENLAYRLRIKLSSVSK